MHEDCILNYNIYYHCFYIIIYIYSPINWMFSLSDKCHAVAYVYTIFIIDKKHSFLNLDLKIQTISHIESEFHLDEALKLIKIASVY